MITAKVHCQAKNETGDGDQRQAVVTFTADYADGRNKEWALYTPTLSMSMTLKGVAADRFEAGKAYTLTFTETEEDPPQN